LLDIAAHELRIDRAEIRRRNLIPANAFSYDKTRSSIQDFAPLSYDSGNYEPILDKRWSHRLPHFIEDEQPKLRLRGATSASAL